MSKRMNILCKIFMIFIILNNFSVDGKAVVVKRSVSPDENEEHTDNSVDRINYNEYPVNIYLFFILSLLDFIE